jgi:YbbR domain-containing protein
MPKKRNERLKKATDIVKTSTDKLDNNTDRVVTPINKAFKFVNERLDFLLTNSIASKLLSLVLSVMLYISVNYGGDINVFGQNNVGKNLTNIPVVAIYDSERLQVEGLPETVDLSLVGSVEAIRRTEVLNQEEVIVDLSNFEPGLNQTVQLLYAGIASGVNVTFSQSSYQVNIYERESQDFMINPELIRVPVDSKYIYDDIKLSQDIVTIRAARHTLDSIARVQALIDVSNQSEDFTTMARLSVIDIDGNPISIIDLSMYEIQVSVSVKEREENVSG